MAKTSNKPEAAEQQLASTPAAPTTPAEQSALASTPSNLAEAMKAANEISDQAKALSIAVAKIIRAGEARHNDYPIGLVTVTDSLEGHDRRHVLNQIQRAIGEFTNAIGAVAANAKSNGLI